jgi:hypothetical protein
MKKLKSHFELIYKDLFYYTSSKYCPICNKFVSKLDFIEYQIHKERHMVEWRRHYRIQEPLIEQLRESYINKWAEQLNFRYVLCYL